MFAHAWRFTLFGPVLPALRRDASLLATDSDPRHNSLSIIMDQDTMANDFGDLTIPENMT